MPYAYRARDPLGKIIEGTLAATSTADVAQQLRRDGLQLLEAVEAVQCGGWFGRRVSRREIVMLTTQLAVMVETGITLSAALDGLISQEKNARLKEVLTDLRNSVQGGSDFSSALEKHPKCFDATYIALVRASEATGSLGEMLERIADYLRRGVENRNKIRAAMIYPAVIAGLALNVTIFLLTYIMPKFMPLFSRKGMKLPTITVVMMNVSHALTEYWYAWLGGTVAIVVGFIFWIRSEQGHRAKDRVLIHLPLLGPLFRKIILSRSISTLGTMIASGVSTLEALRLCGEVAGNSLYRDVWNLARDRVTEGQQINESLLDQPLIPPTLVQMISSGEQSGRLDKVLQKVSSFYDREVESQVKTATSLIEPVMIGIMGVVVGTIGLSLLLPIFSLSRKPG